MVELSYSLFKNVPIKNAINHGNGFKKQELQDENLSGGTRRSKTNEMDSGETADEFGNF